MSNIILLAKEDKNWAQLFYYLSLDHYSSLYVGLSDGEVPSH